MFWINIGHETSDIVSRIQTTIHLTNIYLDRNEEKEKIKNLIGVINDDFKRLYAYSNLIVNFLRKRKRQYQKDIEIGIVLKEVCDFYSDIVMSFGVSLIYSCDKEIMYHIKQIDLESIIINMITNAFEQVKGKDKRRIEIAVKESVSHIILIFEDSGNGVPKGKEKDIFRPFETTKEEGIGLGLNIVKDIVENYKGTINVQRSETLLGAKFMVSLPKGDE